MSGYHKTKMQRQKEYEKGFTMAQKAYSDFREENISVKIKKKRFSTSTVIIEFQNISKENLLIPEIEIPTSNSANNYFFVIKNQKGEEFEYTGDIGDFLFFKEDDFITLKPKQIIKSEIDLSSFYGINKNEIYSVQFKRGNMESNIIKIKKK